MLDLIRDPASFLAGASADEAEADCRLTRAAIGLPAAAGEEPAWHVRTLADWLAARDWWLQRAADAVTAHCGECPACACQHRRGMTEVNSPPADRG